MGKLTSPMGRKWIPLMLAYLFGALTAVGVFEARIWAHWQTEAAVQVAAFEADLRETAEAGQKEARAAARRELLPKGPVGIAPVYPPPTRESMQPPD